MKLELNNLAALVQGREMNMYQRSLAIAEFQSVIEFLHKLESEEIANDAEQIEKQLTIPDVSNSASELEEKRDMEDFGNYAGIGFDD